jgi:nucleoid-associated protein YgaU
LVLPKTEVRKPVETIADQTITGNQYTVVKGDSLWNIAVRAYQDGYQWVKIADENNLGNPDKIHPGNVLNIPR